MKRPKQMAEEAGMSLDEWLGTRAFHTGWLWGYLMKRGIDALPVFDDEGNYQPQVDIKVPLVDPQVEGETKTIRVEVVGVDP